MAELWLFDMFKNITKNVPKDLLEEKLSKFTIIIFNYDRLIEAFLYKSLKNFYNLEHEEVEILMSKINIIHPYGVIYNTKINKYNGLPDRFMKDEYFDIAASISQLRTFTEEYDNVEDRVLILTSIMNSKNIIFLGFGFHPINLEILNVNGNDIYNEKYNKLNVYATTLGMSDTDEKKIKEKLSIILEEKREIDINLTRRTCEGFYDEYKLDLFDY